MPAGNGNNPFIDIQGSKFGYEDQDTQFRRARWSDLAERFGRSQNEIGSIQGQFSKMNDQFIEALRKNPTLSFNQFLFDKNEGRWDESGGGIDGQGPTLGDLKPSNYFTNFFESQAPMQAGRATGRFAPTARRMF